MNHKKIFISSERMLQHIPPFVHAERPERLKRILNTFAKKDIERILDFPPATEEDLLRVHTQEHLAYIKKSVFEKKQLLDEGDTYISDGSLDAAYLAAGSGITAVEKIYSEGYTSAFCAVRPPGHHAETNKVMGFCYFNNVAVAIRYAQAKGYIVDAAVVDWDVHHGNGTQQIFYNDDSVLFFSIHQMPLWPGTGIPSEAGEGKGKGFTVNIPVRPESTGTVYLKILNDTILPRLNQYKPDILFISAGFDAHTDDPLANIDLNEKDFTAFTILLKGFADSLNIPIISMLEGGYNLDALSNCAEQHYDNL